MNKLPFKKLAKQMLIERDAVWRFNEFDLLSFVIIRNQCKPWLMDQFDD